MSTCPDTCEKCEVSWLGDEIPDGLLKTGGYSSREEAEESAKSYGWTPENGKCFKTCTGIYDYLKDEETGWECDKCLHFTERIDYIPKRFP